MKVLLTGASGFVGRAVLSELISRGHTVNALVNRRAVSGPGVSSFAGGLHDIPCIARAAQGCQAVIHLVGIITEKPRQGITFHRTHVEGTRNVLAAAAGAEKFVHMSALGASAHSPAHYHQTKAQAEDLVRASGLKHTIFRPSLILGPRGEFADMLIGWARGKSFPYVAMPYFAPGLLGFGTPALVQPVDVRDVAKLFVDALDHPQTINKSYDLGGPQQLSWPQMYQAVSKAVTGKTKLCMPVPHWYALLLTRVLPASLLPFNRDQVLMSKQNVTADLTPLNTDMGYQPIPLQQTLASLQT